ncbi:hypothetical protein [Spartinivicinus ruber]|uniref:hypothetical protein n=1 Tax=Spartinivicinus ruber TaxID=2683272 RepID=UPI0013D1BEED|nr:hypothetical protein [Spartinivicinus ruber]
MTFFLLSFLIFLLTACSHIETTASEQQTSPTVNEIVIQNDTGEPIDQVKISVQNINGFFNCSQILAGSICLNKFSDRTYQGNPIEVSWIQHYEPWTSGQIWLTLPSQIMPDHPVRAVIVIGNDGQVKASMKTSAQ